jgi:hypothetical protein
VPAAAVPHGVPRATSQRRERPGSGAPRNPRAPTGRPPRSRGPRPPRRPPR